MFKLNADYKPNVVCSVCIQPIFDIWDSLASLNGSTIVFHHAKCPVPVASDRMKLIDFFSLLTTFNRMGDLASDGMNDTIKMSSPTGGVFGS
jgi:hypothetical protein